MSKVCRCQEPVDRVEVTGKEQPPDVQKHTARIT